MPIGHLFIRLAGAAFLVGLPFSHSFAQSDPKAMAAVERAAEALGGKKEILNLHSLQLFGYRQTAYMWGGGNITGDPDAPQKWQANNDLQYNWDFDNNRFQTKYRSNFLFPFAAAFGHSFMLDNRVLDGDIAYNVLPNGQTMRVGISDPGPLETDGAYDRRMWSLTNPVSAVRAALTGEADVSNLRTEGSYDVVDLAVKEGKIILSIDAERDLPHSVSWKTKQSNLGEVTYTTVFTGYAPFSGLRLPLSSKTTLDWRNTVFRTLFVDGYVVNADIGNLAAPDAIRSTPAPAVLVPDLKIEPIADRIWRISNGTTVIEFSDHMAIFELGDNQTVAKAVLNLARSIRPQKPITQLLISHHHFDHTAGIRVAVAAGLTVISKRENEAILHDVVARKAPDFDDALPNGGDLKFVPVDEHLRLGDEVFAIDLYHVVGNNHMADAIFAYEAKSKTMIEGDIGTAAEDWQFWADSYLDNIEKYDLPVANISPVHISAFTHDELIEFIRAGAKRVEDRCSTFAANGDYLPGCPPFIRRVW